MNDIGPTADDELRLLLSTSAGKLYRSADPDDFLAWIAEAGPVLAPSMAAQVDPRTGPAGLFFRILGIAIYNNTPLAERDFTLNPLPKPARNEPCLCGSGRKYKQCCVDMDAQPMLDDYNMLRHVLDHCSQKVLATLPKTRVDTEAVADTAAQWLAAGDIRRALALLEPWFKPDVPVKCRHHPLFKVLMDLYMEQGNTKKQDRVLERACNSEDKFLRADALQRKAMILMDKGRPSDAWDSFKAAQRTDPDAPNLALLEITLLCATGEVEKAKARAGFWLRRLRPRRDVDPEYVSFIEECTEDPQGALQIAAASTEIPYVMEVIELLISAPEPAAHYTLESLDPGAMLLPDNKLRKLEQQWASHALPSKPSLTQIQSGHAGLWETATEWLPLLQQEPTLWHSFEVIDDLVLAVDALGLDELVPALLEPLLSRAEKLLELNLAKAPKNESRRLPWVMLENRPALRLLAHKAFHVLHYHEHQGPGFLQPAERLLTLNPNDNHGMRDPLSTAYIANGQPEKATALAEQFPDDVLCTLPLNKVLALYLQNQKGTALSELATIAPHFKVAINMLLAKAPRQPKVSEYGITVGGKDEAWYYRQSTLPLWKQQGALKWLQQAAEHLANR